MHTPQFIPQGAISSSFMVQVHDFTGLNSYAHQWERKSKAVLDRAHPPGRIVEAYRYVPTGQEAGNVVITVAHDKAWQKAIESRIIMYSQSYPDLQKLDPDS